MVAAPVRLIVPVLQLKVPEFEKFPPKLVVIEPPLKVVPEAIDKLLLIVVATPIVKPAVPEVETL